MADLDKVVFVITNNKYCNDNKGEMLMATLQIRVDDSLKAQAQAVIQNMGLDVSSAVRMFLAQVVKENGLPFRPTNEPFYSVRNQEALRHSAAQIKAGQTVTKSLDELRGME